MPTVLKIMSKDDVHRVQLEGEITYAVVDAAIKQLFPNVRSAKYADDEGDMCTLCEGSFSDFVSTSGNSQGRSMLKLEIVNDEPHRGDEAEDRMAKGQGKFNGKFCKGKKGWRKGPFDKGNSDEQPDAELDPTGEGLLQLCPGGCGFLVTWHDTHCCGACVRKNGTHGGLCEQIRADESITLTSDPLSAMLEAFKGYAKGKGKGAWKGKSKCGKRRWKDNRGDDEADVAKKRKVDTPKPCAGNCGLAATWHGTHCCAACERTAKSDGPPNHGPRCDKIPLPLPTPAPATFDFTFPVEVEDGRSLIIQWNKGDDPETVAEVFSAGHGIKSDERNAIVEFIKHATAVTSGNATADPSMEPAIGSSDNGASGSRDNADEAAALIVPAAHAAPTDVPMAEAAAVAETPHEPVTATYCDESLLPAEMGLGC